MTLTEFLEYTNNPEIVNAFCKAQRYLSKCDKAHCSISGGADEIFDTLDRMCEVTE